MAKIDFACHYCQYLYGAGYWVWSGRFAHMAAMGVMGTGIELEFVGSCWRFGLFWRTVCGRSTTPAVDDKVMKINILWN